MIGISLTGKRALIAGVADDGGHGLATHVAPGRWPLMGRGRRIVRSSHNLPTAVTIV